MIMNLSIFNMEKDRHVIKDSNCLERECHDGWMVHDLKEKKCSCVE